MFYRFIVLLLFTIPAIRKTVAANSTDSAPNTTTIKANELNNSTKTPAKTIITALNSTLLPPKKLLSMDVDLIYHKKRKDGEIKNHLGDFKMVRRKTHFSMPPFDFDLDKILNKPKIVTNTDNMMTDTNDIDTKDASETTKVQDIEENTIKTEENHIHISIARKGAQEEKEINNNTNRKTACDKANNENETESIIEKPLKFSLYNVHHNHINEKRRRKGTKGKERYLNKMKMDHALDEEDYNIGSTLYRRALQHPIIFSNLYKQTLLMEKLLETLEQENILRQEHHESTKINEFIVIINKTQEDRLRQQIGDSNGNGTSEHFIKPENLLYAVDAGTTQMSPKTTPKNLLLEIEELPTLKTLIDETEVRKALINNPFVKRILKLSSIKRQKYLERLKKKQDKTI